MKRLHINLAVSELNKSVRFYTSLFNTQPSILHEDYAKWMLDDPHVNFAITTRGSRKGIDHLGIQVENNKELNETFSRLKKADAHIVAQGETICCYARSEKNWIYDPEGIPWESFLTIDKSYTYGSDNAPHEISGSSCCTQIESATSCGDKN